MSALVTGLVVLATLAFGAVYPWGYVPLFAAAACIGLAGLARERGPGGEVRWLAAGLAVTLAAMAVQLVPLPRAVLDVVSPRAGALLSQYDLAFAASADPHPLSINARATVMALVAFAALSVYLVGLPAMLSRGDLRRLPRNLMLFAVPLAVLGIYGREHNNGLVYGFWQPIEGTNANGFGPFVNRNHFAGWMLMATCLAAGVLCARVEQGLQRARPGFRNRLVWLSTPDASRVILIGAAIAAMSVSVIWTMSRSGILSFAGALACFAWLLIRRRQAKRAGRAATVMALGTALVASVSWRGLGAVANWFSDTTDVVSRLAAWRDGWQVARDFTLTGTGLNTYADAMLFYQRSLDGVSITRAHNDYLQVFAEGGLLVAMPAVLAAVLLALAISRRVRQASGDVYGYWVRAGAAVALVGMALQEAVEFSLHIPANAFLFATLAAIAISPVRSSASSGRRRGTEDAARRSTRQIEGRGRGAADGAVVNPSPFEMAG